MNDVDAPCHSDKKREIADSINAYLENESQLFRSCQSFCDNDFEDYEAQAMLSATYILWIIKVLDFLLHSFTVDKLPSLRLILCHLCV